MVSLILSAASVALLLLRLVELVGLSVAAAEKLRSPQWV